MLHGRISASCQGVDTAEVAAVARVDLQLVAGVDEQRDGDLGAASIVAGLVPPVERSPCRPGSVWVTTISTVTGSSMNSGTPSLRDT